MHFSACLKGWNSASDHMNRWSPSQKTFRDQQFKVHQWTKKEIFWYFHCIQTYFQGLTYLSGTFANLHLCLFVYQKTRQLRLWGNCVSVSRQASLVWVGISVQAGTFRSETMHVCSLSLPLGLAFRLQSLGVQGFSPTPVISRVNNLYK